MSTTAERTAARTRVGDAGVSADSPDSAAPRAGRVEMVLEQIEQLPTLPAVATHLLTMTTRPDTSAREVIDVLESDPSLTAKILSVARRVDSGIPSDAATVDKAVVLMGFDAIRNIALSIKVFEAFGPEGDDTHRTFSRTEFWKHSLAVACAAQLVAAELPEPLDQEEAFVCGLVHDIGKVALDTCLPKSFERIVQLAAASRCCMADAERQVLGIDHTVAGRRLAQRWGLPDKLVNTIWLHHQGRDGVPQSVSDRGYIEVVHLADLIAREQRIGSSGNTAFPERAATVAQSMGLDTRSLERVVAQLADRIEARDGIVGLERLTSERLYLGALSAANEELGELNAALAQSNRTLRLRARFFDALRHFGAATSSTARPRDICAAAAEGVSIATGASAVMVFLHNPSDGVWHTGLKTGEAEPTSEMLLIEGDEPSEDAERPPTGPSAPILLPAEPYARSALEAFAGRLGRPPFWFVPLALGSSSAGGFAGAVFAASTERVETLARTDDEMRTLATALGLALGGADARAKGERLNEELAAVNRRMRDTEGERVGSRSLSMIAEMAAGAGHELNNPLAVISGRAQLLGTQTDDDDTQQSLQLIKDQATQCSRIVSELMTFARPEPAEPTQVELSALLEQIRASFLAEHSLTAEQFTVRIAADAHAVWADADHVRVIIGELVRNAWEAYEGKPVRLVVNCRAEVADDTIVAEVSDEGRGMAPDVLQRAFDPFYSHRPAGRGRGLGLSRAHRLAEVNRGRLWLESTETVGTTACLKLPARADVDAREPA